MKIYLKNVKLSTQEASNILEGPSLIDCIRLEININSVKRGNEEAVDVGAYDVQKCFDALWLEEAVSDLYESGLTNDKLSILYLENQRNKRTRGNILASK